MLEQNFGATIKVIGVGGGGGNAVAHMMRSNIVGVEFICANTDAQVLKDTPAKNVIQLGAATTKGLGAGTNPDVGRQAALEQRDLIRDQIQGAEMLFITTGMGGGTGTGAAPVIAQVAKEMGILSVAVVTTPFTFEGRKRALVAKTGLQELENNVDCLIVIPNNRLLEMLSPDVSMLDAFATVDNVLTEAVRGISDILLHPGLMNVDFADLKAVMTDAGVALMGNGSASGANRAVEAAEKALFNPLLSEVDLRGARGFLVNITAGTDLSLAEYSRVGALVEEYAADDATVKLGCSVDPNMGDTLKVTIVATGLNVKVGDLNQTERPSARQQAQQNQAPAAPVLQQPVRQAQELRQPSPNYETHDVGVSKPRVLDNIQQRQEPVMHRQMPRNDVEQQQFHQPQHQHQHQPLHQPQRQQSPVARGFHAEGGGARMAASSSPIDFDNRRPARPAQIQTRPITEAQEEFLDIPAFLRRQTENS